MSVPGMNLLNMAGTVIRLQTVQYYKYLTRTKLPDGILVPTYAEPVPVKGSFQAIARDKYEYLGLDFAKSYFNLYTSSCVLDLQRDVSSDQFTFANKRYQVETNTPWDAIDGWVQARCYEIPKC